VRRSLAAAQLKAGLTQDAALEASASLARWRDDPLALQVLAEAEAKLGRSRDAARHREAALRAWRGQGPMPGLELI
jgi:hypothetical protein